MQEFDQQEEVLRPDETSVIPEESSSYHRPPFEPRKPKKTPYVLAFLTGALLSLLVIGVLLTTLGIYPPRRSEGSVLTPEENRKLATLKNMIEKVYLFPYSEQDQMTGIYKGYLAGLKDRYSEYYTKKEFHELMEEGSGKLVGIGVLVTNDEETGLIKVLRVYDGGAREAGILPGDRIIKVNGKSIVGETLTLTVKKMRGEANTSVDVTVLRGENNEEHTFKIVRREIDVPTVNGKMLDNGIAYLQITQFNENTDQQFLKEYQRLESENMKGLIIDLRNNPGGYLLATTHILRQLLPKGIIYSTKDKNGKGDTVYSDGEHEFKKPLAVLINEHSASAAEVFAGAIKDYNMGPLIGEKSYGKGIVQNIWGLSDGSGFKLTTAKYYSPKGINIHKKGIEPDLKVEATKKMMTSIDVPVNEDTQLQAAIKYMKEKVK